MPDNDICPKCERSVQGKSLYCKICRAGMNNGNDNNGPPNGEVPEVKNQQAVFSPLPLDEVKA